MDEIIPDVMERPRTRLANVLLKIDKKTMYLPSGLIPQPQ